MLLALPIFLHLQPKWHLMEMMLWVCSKRILIDIIGNFTFNGGTSQLMKPSAEKRL
jgi:hypothetical protein